MFAYGIAASRLRFGSGRRRAARALHRSGAAAPVRRIPRRDRHRVPEPGLRRRRRGLEEPRSALADARPARPRVPGAHRRRRHGHRPALGRLRIRSAAAALGFIFGLAIRSTRRRSAARWSSPTPSRRRRRRRRERRGTVKNKADGKPIAEAVVAFTGQPRARVATRSGRELPEHPAAARASRHHRRGRRVRGRHRQGERRRRVGSTDRGRAGREGRQRQRARAASLDRGGQGRGGHARFNGPNTFEAHADASGAFSAVLPAGPYGSPSRRRATRTKTSRSMSRPVRTSSSTSRCGRPTPT